MLNWSQPCGTLGCILGDYVIQATNMDITQILIECRRGLIEDLCLVLDLEKEFGIIFKRPKANHPIFTANINLWSLEDRLTWINDHITSHKR